MWLSRSLVRSFAQGNGVKPDVALAVRYFRSAADRGQRVAAYNLATCYYNGDGVPRDYAQAANFYRLAADAGLPKAQLLLAELYEAGEGVAQDMEQALKYWKLAAEQGEADAQNAFAETLIQQRLEEPAAWEEAKGYLELAAAQVCRRPAVHCYTRALQRR